MLQSGSGMQRLVPELRPGSLVDDTLKVHGEEGALGGGDQQGHPFVLPLVLSLLIFSRVGPVPSVPLRVLGR